MERTPRGKAGVETDAGQASAADTGDVVSRHLISKVTRGDRHPDSGWGLGQGVISKVEAEWAEYRREKLAKVLGGHSLPTDCVIVWDPWVSYAGEGPEPRFEGPGYSGRVVYEQDNSRQADDRMVASIEWSKTVEGSESAHNRPA